MLFERVTSFTLLLETDGFHCLLPGLVRIVHVRLLDIRFEVDGTLWKTKIPVVVRGLVGTKRTLLANQ